MPQLGIEPELNVTNFALFLAPSMVGKIHSTDRSFDWIALTWSKPLHPNGKLLAYEVEYHLKETSLTTQTPKIQKVSTGI